MLPVEVAAELVSDCLAVVLDVEEVAAEHGATVGTQEVVDDVEQFTPAGQEVEVTAVVVVVHGAPATLQVVVGEVELEVAVVVWHGAKTGSHVVELVAVVCEVADVLAADVVV